jgi:hypothetical protein
MMDDFYKTCRWCHWFKNGKCLHGKTFRNSKSETDIVYLAEEGVISEAIKEGFTEKAFSNLKSNLESSLSKKKAKEFMQSFFEELEAAKTDWTETIDEAVTTALQNAIDEGTEEAAEIIEPEEFCCKYFM